VLLSNECGSALDIPEESCFRQDEDVYARTAFDFSLGVSNRGKRFILREFDPLPFSWSLAPSIASFVSLGSFRSFFGKLAVAADLYLSAVRRL
jgi:hypothetical protein